MTRRVTAAAALGLIVAVLVFDLTTAGVNPFNAPAPFALGSNVKGGGAFCGELPS